mmetsp:Transcript_11314/g.17800  ORF Transcript_11314/g.17800 Transcript_11314/m.17800 type:complete len:158 (+) Transcript_11314:2-475(+)
MDWATMCTSWCEAKPIPVSGSGDGSYTSSRSSTIHHPSVALTGVGIVFREDKTRGNGLFVVALAAGGPAQCSGKIRAGQKLLEIDGKDVSTKSAAEIAPIILGPAGTRVVLKLQSAQEHYPPEIVELFRAVGTPLTPTSKAPGDTTRLSSNASSNPL